MDRKAFAKGLTTISAVVLSFSILTLIYANVVTPAFATTSTTTTTIPSLIEAWVDDDYDSTSCATDGHTWGYDCFDNIQDGINAVTGSTVYVAAGTYTGTLNLQGKEFLNIYGAGIGNTVIDASGLSGYAIHNFGDHTTIKDLTLIGSNHYGFKVYDVSDITLQNIRVENSGKTGVDLNTVSGADLDNIQVVDTVGGFGIMLLDCNNVQLNDIMTNNNPWGGVTIHAINANAENIIFSGSFDANENVPLLLEKDSPYSGGFVNLNLPAKFGYVTYGFREGHNYMQWHYQETLSDAKSIANALMASSFTYSGMLIYDVAELNYYVIPGMLIQDAIDAATDNDMIHVDAGTYEELLTINKPLTLRGATFGVNKNGYVIPANYAWDDTVESIIQPPAGHEDSDVITVDDASDVTIEGFVVQALERSVSGTRMLVHVLVDDGNMENFILRNNVIGPNTNVVSQDGTKGRMSIDLDINPYDESMGLTNSLIAGNKIFGSEGNGNAIFIWASYSSYGATGPSPMTGTVIEDNEICCGHRSGIETAGGLSGLTIRNNDIHDFSGLPGDDPDMLKYGNAILLIRGSGDKTNCDGFGPEDLTIVGNEIYNNEKNAIYMGPNNDGVTISGNDIYNNGWNGVIVDLIGNYWNPDFEPTPGPYTCLDGSTNVVVNYNNLYNNAENGVSVNGEPTNGFILDAEDNYWGHYTGPDFPTENTGYGDSASGSVDVCPFWDSYPNGDSTACYLDTDGPIVSDIVVNPPVNPGVFDVTATVTDAEYNSMPWSPIKTVEYFVNPDNSAYPDCGTFGTGTTIYPSDDGTFDFDNEIEFVLAENVITTDGYKKICMQGQDIQNNWGSCSCAYFNVDTIGPELLYDLAVNDVMDSHELLICDDNPNVTVTVCDTQSHIQGGEFFLDLVIPPDSYPASWSGYWLDKTNNYVRTDGWKCSDLEGQMNQSEFNNLSDGTHYISHIHGKDRVENWGKLNDQNFEYSFIKDTTAPKTFKELIAVDDVAVQCYGYEMDESDMTDITEGSDAIDDCYYVKAGSSIVLTAYDFNPDDDTNDGYNDLEGEYADNVKISYKLYYKADIESEWELIGQEIELEGPVEIMLDEDSYHLIEYWSVDGCGYESEHRFELDVVDTQSPVLTKTIVGPQFYNETEEKLYIDGVTQIQLDCVDPEPHPVDDVTIYYRYNVDDGEWTEWIEYYEPFGFPEESKHTLQYYCEDALGNSDGTDEQPYVEIDYVDHTKPVTTIDFGTPYFEIENNDWVIKWITSQTPITLSADDGDEIHDSGVDYTLYRVTKLNNNDYCYTAHSGCSAAVGSGEWDTYTGQFTIGEDSCHLIEYYSVDNVEKTEVEKRECVFVDNQAPSTIKTVSEPKVEGTDGVHYWITDETEIELSCFDPAPHPVGYVTLHYRWNLDGNEWNGWYNDTDGYVLINFDDSDSNHTLEWYCEDILGNTEETDTELDVVDTKGPTIVKWVDDNTVQSGDTVTVCANITDTKQTGDAGVGVNPYSVYAKFTLADDPIWISLDYVEDDTYCGEWTAPSIENCWKCWGWPEHCEYRCAWDLHVSAVDLLGNFNIEDGIEIIVDDAEPELLYVLNPVSGRYYSDGKSFSVYAPVIDFGGDENIYNSDNCKASGVSECRFYAWDYWYEGINQSEVKNKWDYMYALGEILSNPNVVYLGSVPYVDGICKGVIEIPEESGLTDKVFLAYEIEDNAGNMNGDLARDINDDLILMDMDNDGPEVIITELGSTVEPLSGSDYIENLIAEIIDPDSGFIGCYAELYKNDTYTGKKLSGYNVGDNICEINDDVPDGLESGNDYELRIYAVDGQGNTGYDWASLIIDNDAPNITVIAPQEDYYSDSLPIELEIIDELAGVNDSTVEFRVYHEECGWFGCDDVDDLVGILDNTSRPIYTYYVNISELDENTQYYLGIRASDNVGNINDTNWHSIPFGIDKNAPEWSDGATLTVTNSPYDIDGNVTLSWPVAVDELSGMDHYNVYVYNSTGYLIQYLSTNETSADINDLEDGNYTFKVTAVDEAMPSGNENSPLEGSTTVDSSCTVNGVCTQTTTTTTVVNNGGGGGGGGAPIVTCVLNGVCDDGEDYENCPSDCPLDTTEETSSTTSTTVPTTTTTVSEETTSTVPGESVVSSITGMITAGEWNIYYAAGIAGLVAIIVALILVKKKLKIKKKAKRTLRRKSR